MKTFLFCALKPCGRSWITENWMAVAVNQRVSCYENYSGENMHGKNREQLDV
jgi:hypothetical protein